MVKTIERTKELTGGIPLGVALEFGKERNPLALVADGGVSPNIASSAANVADFILIEQNEKQGLLNILPETLKTMGGYIIDGLTMMAEMYSCRMCFMQVNRFECC